jgi:ubiquinone/menaquinone biosynthesis C-methylase UbiE
MGNSRGWRRIWEDESRQNVTNFHLDRGISPRDQITENLSENELVTFIGPLKSDTLLDAGCGTGINILRLHERVRNVIGIDFTLGSLERCLGRFQEHKVKNTQLCLASVAAIPLPDRSVDRIICLSVLQYLNDSEVRRALREFVRVLTPGGVMILHVKNSSSLYWLTLRIAKRIKRLLGRSTRLYYLRQFQWYVDELEAANCRVVDYNSFNLLNIDFMPKWLVSFLQRLELRHYNGFLLRLPVVRRHGADLKIKAAVASRSI